MINELGKPKMSFDVKPSNPEAEAAVGEFLRRRWTRSSSP